MSIASDLIDYLSTRRAGGYDAHTPVEVEDLLQLARIIGEHEKKSDRLQAVADVLDGDGHTFSLRPCETCAFVTKMIGRPFGCDRRMAERAKRTP